MERHIQRTLHVYADRIAKTLVALLALVALSLIGYVAAFALLPSDLNDRLLLILFVLLTLIVPVSVSAWLAYQLISKTEALPGWGAHTLLGVVAALYVGTYAQERARHAIYHREVNLCSNEVVHRMRFASDRLTILPVAALAFKPLMWAEQVYWTVGYPHGSTDCPSR